MQELSHNLKRTNANFMLLTLLVTMLTGCAASPSSASKEPSLDDVIKQASLKIEERLDKGTKVALINVQSPTTQFSDYVLTYLESVLVNNGKLIVVDRANLDKIRQEQGFQLSGEVSDESAKKIGKMLGAGAIVTGTLINIGDSYRLTLKAINVETATVAASYPADIAKSERVKILLAPGNTATATAPNSQASTAAKTATVTPTVTATAAYKIGDTGPAGGIIFYDKGNNIGGWRYLEAAPQNTEAKVKWSHERYSIDAVINQRALGLGKQNTQKIMEVFNNKGGGFDTAARVCYDLVVNGFDDWFLPSFDELNWMYGNLHKKGIGGFKNERYGYYWSSTQEMFNTAFVIDFSDGRQTKSDVIYAEYVRAIRQF